MRGRYAVLGLSFSFAVCLVCATASAEPSKCEQGLPDSSLKRLQTQGLDPNSGKSTKASPTDDLVGSKPTGQLFAPPHTTQVQGAYDGVKADSAQVTTAAVVVVTLLRKGASDWASCNGLQYAPGLIATNRHCFDEFGKYDFLFVDFGSLKTTPVSSGNDPAPDYQGQFRRTAVRDAKYSPPQGADVAVVRVTDVPNEFKSAVVDFDPNGGVGPVGNAANAVLVNYWMDPDYTAEVGGKKTHACRLVKYVVGPPNCEVDWKNSIDLPNPCLPRGQLRHSCDSGRGSSGAPLYAVVPVASKNSTGGATAHIAGLTAIGLNANGVPDRSNCAVPAAVFAPGLPRK